MLHAQVSINAHDTTKVKVYLRCTFEDSHLNPLFIRNVRAQTDIAVINSCLHVYLHIVMRVSKATLAEYHMNRRDVSEWRPGRGKSISPFSWMQEQCGAWDVLVWSTDPIFQGEFPRLRGAAGPNGLAQRLKNGYKDNAVYWIHYR